MEPSDRTVLVIEDDPHNRIIFGTILRHIGLPVVEGSNGPEGIRLAREDPPALILLDISLPGMDGWAVMEALRADVATAEVQVIALTAHTLSRSDLEDAGFCGYLQKPLEPRVLAAEVERCLGLRAGERLSATS